jgi:hypothetical protein
MSKSDAEKYRLAQVEKLFDLFEGAHGRPAATIEEVEEWLKTPEGKKATAYDRTPSGKIIPDPPGG